jgi:hypothetical protein
MARSGASQPIKRGRLRREGVFLFHKGAMYGNTIVSCRLDAERLRKARRQEAVGDKQRRGPALTNAISVSEPDDWQTLRLRRCPEIAVVSREADGPKARTNEQRARDVEGVQGADSDRERLGRALEHRPIHANQLEAGQHGECGCPPAGELAIGHATFES